MSEALKLGIFSNHTLLDKIQNSHVNKYTEMQQSIYADVSLKSSRRLIYRSKGDAVGGQQSFPNQKPLREKLPCSVLN